MARSLNRATLLGNLGKDPELRTTPQGTSVCKFTMATTEKYKDRNGEWQEVTDWHNIVIWDKLGEVAAQYLKKGSKVLIEGKIKTRTYEQDGVTKYFTDINANTMIMLDSKGSSESYGGESFSQPTESSSEPWEKDINPKEDDDDIPF